MTRSKFEALEAMANANGDITSTNIFVRGQSTKRGDEITMGISDGMLMKIGSGKYIVCLFVINAEEYQKYIDGTEAK